MKKAGRNNSVSGGAVVGTHGLSFNMGDVNNIASNGFMQSQQSPSAFPPINPMGSSSMQGAGDVNAANLQQIQQNLITLLQHKCSQMAGIADQEAKERKDLEERLKFKTIECDEFEAVILDRDDEIDKLRKEVK